MKKLLLTAILAGSASTHAAFITWDRFLNLSPTAQEIVVATVADQFDTSSTKCIPKGIDTSSLRDAVVTAMQTTTPQDAHGAVNLEIALHIADQFNCKFTIVDSLEFKK